MRAPDARGRVLLLRASVSQSSHGTAMSGIDVLSRSVAIPVAVLTELRSALRREAGPLGATHALHAAGFAAGEPMYERFAARIDGDPASLGELRFWEEASRFFEEEGWGSFEHERVHSGLGILRAPDWAEANPKGDESQPGCAFSSGMLACVLGKVAGGPVAVLEVRCRSRNDDHCGFLFGSESAIHDVYGLLLDGIPLESVLSRL
jgi:predicted hydrocarbon binding protein